MENVTSGKASFLAVCLLFVVPAFAQNSEREAWPTFDQFESQSRDLVDLRSVQLPNGAHEELVKIVSRAITLNCRRALDSLGTGSVDRKIGIKRIYLADPWVQTYLLQGGMDFEDTSDDCFSDGRLNFDTWVLIVSDRSAGVLLRTMAMSFTIMRSQNAGLHDVVTLQHKNSTFDFELSWWKFDGKRYGKIRCASEQIPTTGKPSTIHQHPCR